jgi:tRNA (guanine37-N1)-methyltransferase
VKAFNEDGREFIRASVRRMKEWYDTEKEVVIPGKPAGGKKGKGKKLTPAVVFRIPNIVNHFVMNLPATAIKFLGIAKDEPR